MTLEFLSGCLRPQGNQIVVFNPWLRTTSLVESIFSQYLIGYITVSRI